MYVRVKRNFIRMILHEDLFWTNVIARQLRKKTRPRRTNQMGLVVDLSRLIII